MTTADAPKQPATPYDAEYEQLDKRLTRLIKDGNEEAFFTRHSRAEAIGKREGWLARSADLAPLHRQLVGALRTLNSVAGEIWLTEESSEENGGRLEAAREKANTALDAARKAGLS